ncbi:MAG: hypothetical protein A2542_01440 [Parcubacteria group bacterium RIFOXYD2_FULL_52_8]|nr:MAG: hypothetical protein A2542_01440 [Parcubacteria group bacterium RIFOXYD2_FULL_52_8]
MISVWAGKASFQLRYRKGWTAEQYIRKTFKKMEEDFLPNTITVNSQRRHGDYVIEADGAAIRFEARDASHPPPAWRAGQAERRRQGK